MSSFGTDDVISIVRVGLYGSDDVIQAHCKRNGGSLF